MGLRQSVWTGCAGWDVSKRTAVPFPVSLPASREAILAALDGGALSFAGLAGEDGGLVPVEDLFERGTLTQRQRRQQLLDLGLVDRLDPLGEGLADHRLGAVAVPEHVERLGDAARG